MKRTFKELFPRNKPIIGMLHLGGHDATDRMRRAMGEFRILEGAGFDAVIVENYFGPASDMRGIVEAVKSTGTDVRVGVNVLGDAYQAVNLARNSGADFIQIDSVCGHCSPDDDPVFAEELLTLIGEVDAPVLGGVRFKYQPVLSGRTEAEDVRIGKTRCEAIVITADRTGQETEMAKVERFRKVVGDDYPLVIGAGLTADNVAEQLAVADAGIVGSWLKEDHIDRGEMSAEYTEIFMSAVYKARAADQDEQRYTD